VRFPRVIGNDGAGVVVAKGRGVSRFELGDRVYAYSLESGFYAEFVAVPEDNVSAIPSGLDPLEAGALGADGITALHGLDEQLRVRRGDRLLIFGASGGIGHIAVQLAKRLGAQVLAVASGRDGVELVQRLGADVAIDGHRDDPAQAARAFAPDGLDGALVLTDGRLVDEALAAVKKDGRVAYPRGVDPEPTVPGGVQALPYDGTPNREAFERLNRLIGPGPFHVELGHVYNLEDAARAHRDVRKHHLGKLALRVH
jgi:NADPH:quinone reductase